MARSGGGDGDGLALHTLDIDELREVRIQRLGYFRESGEPFPYVVRLLRTDDVDGLMELHEEIIASLPDPLILYRREACFFEECVTEGCVAGALDGDRIFAYAALFVPGRARTNYGRDLGLEGDELMAVGHLAGSAVAPPYRGNRLQRVLVALRNRYAVRSGRHHMCGEVVPTNVISIMNHLAEGFYLTGHRIDDYGDRCYVLHADLRHQPSRVPGDETVEIPVSDVAGYVEQIADGRRGYRVEKREEDWHLQFGRFQ